MIRLLLGHLAPVWPLRAVKPSEWYRKRKRRRHLANQSRNRNRR